MIIEYKHIGKFLLLIIIIFFNYWFYFETPNWSSGKMDNITTSFSVASVLSCIGALIWIIWYFEENWDRIVFDFSQDKDN